MEKIIQFGEGGFLRGFVDWMIQICNEKTDFDGQVVVVQPIAMGMCDLLDKQNGLYTHVIRGKEGVDKTIVDVISRTVKPYDDFNEYLALAENPDFRFIFSNTTEAGIVFENADKPTDTPPNTFPAKLTLLLKRRFDLGLKGFICENRLPKVGDIYHEGNIGFHLRAGLHYFSREDWNIYMDFIDKA